MYVERSFASYVLNTFYATFSTSDLREIPGKQPYTQNQLKYIKFSSDALLYDASDFGSAWSYIDPFKDILSLFFAVPVTDALRIQYECTFKVKKPRWKKLIGLIEVVWGWFGPKAEKDEKESAEEKERKRAWRDVVVSVWLHITKQQQSMIQDIVYAYDKFLKEWSVKLSSKRSKIKTNLAAFVNMYHLPTKINQNKSLHYVEYRKLPYPVTLPTLKNTPEEQITVLWTTDFKWSGMSFGIKKEDKFRHVYIVWKTWMGKSTFISNMVRSDMHRDNGIAVVDPHGDLVEDVMSHIPSHRVNDVILFDVSDTDNPVGFNILEYNTPDEKNLVASAVVSIFKKLFAHSRWPRLEYVLRNVLLSILEYPNATLMHVVRMLTDKHFREEVLSNVSDPIVMKFWRDEYDKRQEKQKNEAVGPIANKIGQFLSSPIVRNIFAQPKSSLKLRQAMDEWKILLINLSKWKIGEDNASMIGSFLVSKFQIDAMSRADVDFRDRKDFYLYIDEFQNFATDSFESILSEARKYRLSLIVANQYTSQIQENVRNAIFGNVWTIVSFGLGYDDATMMSQQFKEMISANDLLSLPKFKAYIKLMVDGTTTDPFTMGTFPLPDLELSREIKDKIKRQSRQRYSIPREKLEELLNARAKKQFTATEKQSDSIIAKAVKEAWWTKMNVKDLEIGKSYTGYVKLIYNYWIFVTVAWVEWLLHKSAIKMPEWVAPTTSWKDFYVSWDQITVKVWWFKEIDGHTRVVWEQ